MVLATQKNENRYPVVTTAPFATKYPISVGVVARILKVCILLSRMLYF